MRRFGTILEAHRGIGPGFDFLRVFLATCIVAVHSYMMTGHLDALRASPFWIVEHSVVPMFFALSGFLITGSAQRLSLGNFLLNRGLRIVPALAVDIFFCALVIGPLMTTVPLGNYFSGADFFKYFLNITGYIHYILPGVFPNNPTVAVNGALWTVPYEIICYAIMSLFIVLGWLNGRWKPLCLAFGSILLGLLLLQWPPSIGLSPRIDRAINFFLISNRSEAVTCFLFGVAAYQWRDAIPYAWSVMVLCTLLCLGAAFLPDIGGTLYARFILLPALAYITAFLGLTTIKIPSYFVRGDYSYGIYLYHSPFLQVVIALFPAIALVGWGGVLFVFAAGYVMVLGVSNLSWHFIEKPILKLRKRFSFVARVRDLSGGHTGTTSPNIERKHIHRQ